ncbi:hypothetical protein VTJ04DRAFT_8029 [Mycothermus thermophilus]|uniref:uncharacterized protein n=1 Tax=Humicola insolens TaxID=85995 RepID=UPI0037420D68
MPLAESSRLNFLVLNNNTARSYQHIQTAIHNHNPNHDDRTPLSPLQSPNPNSPSPTEATTAAPRLPGDFKVRSPLDWPLFHAYIKARADWEEVWYIVNPDETRWSEDDMIGDDPVPRFIDTLVRVREEYQQQFNAQLDAWNQADPATRGPKPVLQEPTEEEVYVRHEEVTKEYYRGPGAAPWTLLRQRVVNVYNEVINAVEWPTLRRMLRDCDYAGDASCRALIRWIRDNYGPGPGRVAVMDGEVGLASLGWGEEAEREREHLFAVDCEDWHVR